MRFDWPLKKPVYIGWKESKEKLTFETMFDAKLAKIKHNENGC